MLGDEEVWLDEEEFETRKSLGRIARCLSVLVRACLDPLRQDNREQAFTFSVTTL